MGLEPDTQVRLLAILKSLVISHGRPKPKVFFFFS